VWLTTLYIPVTSVVPYIECTREQNRPTIETSDGFRDGHTNFSTETGKFAGFDRWRYTVYVVGVLPSVNVSGTIYIIILDGVNGTFSCYWHPPGPPLRMPNTPTRVFDISSSITVLQYFAGIGNRIIFIGGTSHEKTEKT